MPVTGKKKLCLVLGSPRCGSSAFTGCLQLCGVSLGKTLTTAKDRHNAKGYFENQEVLNLNQKTLLALGLDWDKPYKLEPQQMRLLMSLEPAFAQMIQEEFTESVSAIKDPRIIILWPLYKKVLESLGFQVSVVILRRTPTRTSARSLQVMFPKYSLLSATKICVAYYDLLHGLNLQEQYPLIQVDFSDLLRDAKQIMGRVCGFLDLSVSSEVVSFVEARLVHQR